ncbi:hypothetical protein GCM10011490_17430 [Pseudoclavibacter endophyticus]|uniref:Uncharacterized protein n=1 Tax=Pseudoclavibacter endophyticus TaxID=1778590 RepID=A0A6H9WQ39_9MICO|nr:hypothetical protein [Pseudoclavibacter endophyticus]KAB1648905.1 hypothetical protein F8O04_00945 [Pseudoclavibacter endophyticus]GGA67363.1 hypothetical protein GCM10011490_17430 [Pseudoclavibacter endophyticus]
MTERHDRNDITGDGDGRSDDASTSERGGFGSSDYSAPKLYESSDFLSKYTSPTLPADTGSSDAEATETDTSASGEYTVSFDSSGDAASLAASDTPSSDNAGDAERATPGHADDDRQDSRDGDPDGDPDDETARRQLLEQFDSVARRLEAQGAAAAGSTATTLRIVAHRAANADAPELPAGAWTPDDGSSPTVASATSKGPHNTRESNNGTPKKSSNLTIFLAVGLLVVALFNAPGFVWPAGIVLGIAAIIQIANPTGSKSRGIVALVIIAITLVVQIVVSTGALSGGLGGGAGSGSEATLDVDANPTVEGSGNAVLDVVLPDGDGVPAVIEVTSTGETVRISEIDAEREDSWRVYTSYRQETGLAPINTSADVPTVALEIESSGDWVLTLRSVTSLRSFDETITGSKNDLVYYTGDGGDAVFTLTPDDSVSIDTYAADDDWWFSNGGITSFTRPFESGPVLIQIEAYDEWAISVEPADDLAAGGAGATDAPADSADAAGGSPDEIADAVPTE